MGVLAKQKVLGLMAMGAMSVKDMVSMARGLKKRCNPWVWKGMILSMDPSTPRLNSRAKGLEGRLCKALRHYTDKNGRSYDRVFDEAVRARFPHWFSWEKESERMKKELLAMPAWTKRPGPWTKLGQALCNYTNKTKGKRSYDARFDREIRKIHARDDWFKPRSWKNKRKLMRMKKRPHPRSPLGQAFYKFSTPRSPYYDKAWTERKRTISPDWFISQHDRVAEIKRMLLAMPPRSKMFPRNSKLYNALRNYTNKSGVCYDPKFFRAIRKKQPHWFENWYKGSAKRQSS